MSASVPTVKLNDGTEIPAIAFGTGTRLFGQDATEYVDRALQAGFSHIDTAAAYRNEDSVGVAIRESGLARDDVYVTTKYGGAPAGEADIGKAVQISLDKLGLKSVDLYLIHHPRLVEGGDFEGAWRDMEKVQEDGLAKSIGVSNFTVEQLQTVVKTAKVKPAVNQIRFHPYNYAEYKDLLAYSAKHGIVTEAYSSLAPITTFPGGALDPVLAGIAKRIGGSPAQVIFKWVLAKGAVVVTTSSNKSRIEEYLAVPSLPDLTFAEIAAIDAAGASGPPTSSLAARGAVYVWSRKFFVFWFMVLVCLFFRDLTNGILLLLMRFSGLLATIKDLIWQNL